MSRTAWLSPRNDYLDLMRERQGFADLGSEQIADDTLSSCWCG
jgi:hypothetical protein